MKYYSDYSKKYVQDICDALNSEERDVNLSKPYVPENYLSLTNFLKSTVVFIPNVFYYLDEKGLVNTGRCPYTGVKIDYTSPSWNYMDRSVYISKEGAEIFQKESEEDSRRILL
jgi:hypothetical protein